MLNSGFEVPAGHLAQGKPPAKFIRRYFLIPFAYIESNVKGFAYREFNTVKNGAVHGRFF